MPTCVPKPSWLSHVDQVDVSKFEANITKMTFTDKTLYGMRVLLCQQVDKIKQMPPSTPSSSKVFSKYQLVIAKQTLQPETQVRQWACQLYSALDHLGDMAICHRALKPTNVSISQIEWTIKLTEFHYSIVYWNAQIEDINYLPCLSLSCQSQVSADFEALEVYGDAEKDQFDPIMADIWSYGAVLYFAASQGNYPFNCALDNPKVEQEIQANVDKLPLSGQVKAWQHCYSCIQTNALTRIPFGQIGRHGWLALHYICDI